MDFVCMSLQNEETRYKDLGGHFWQPNSFSSKVILFHDEIHYGSKDMNIPVFAMCFKYENGQKNHKIS